MESITEHQRNMRMKMTTKMKTTVKMDTNTDTIRI